MRGSLSLAILFAILAIIFGFWTFGAAAPAAWAGVKVFFWIFVVLFVLSVLVGIFGRRTAP